MKSRVLPFLLTTLLLSLLSSAVDAQPTLYIVRHAEKLSGWPKGKLANFQPLSAEGIARAQRLADRFEPGSLAAIYTSLTTRTAHTALPVAQKLGLEITVAQAVMDTSAIDSFYADLARRFGPEDAVLLVSHSNIIPYLLLKAGLPSDCRDEMGITASTKHTWLLIEGYDNLWRVDQAGGTGEKCKGFRKLKF